jgi:hypothetical protein
MTIPLPRGCSPRASARRTSRVPSGRFANAPGAAPRARRLRARVGDKEDQVILAAVLTLLGEAAFEGLDVIEDRLGFDCSTPAGAADRCVPRSEIAIDPQRHLGRPAQARVEAGVKTLEEALLPRVPDRIAGRKRPEPHVQTDRRAARRQLPDRRASRTGLEPLHSRPGQAARLADLLAAQPRVAPSTDKVNPDARLVLESAPDRASHGSVPDGHGAMFSHGHVPRLNCTLHGRCETRTNCRTALTTRIRPFSLRIARRAGTSTSGRFAGRRNASSACNHEPEGPRR